MRKKTLIVVALFGIVVVSAVAALLLWRTSMMPPSPVIPAVGEMDITVSLPLTGDAAIWGTSQKEGYDLFLDMNARKTGMRGLKLRLHYFDDKGLPKDGVSGLMHMMATGRMNYLTGVANSSVALAYIPISTKNKILFISSGASSPKLTGASPYFFRTWPSDIAEALAMAKYARQELKLNSAAVLYINNDYGLGLKTPFIERFEEMGGKITAQDSFEQAATDFRAQILKVKASHPEAVYLAGNPNEMVRVITQLKEAGYQGKILSISALNDPSVLGSLPQDLLEGLLITDASVDLKEKDPKKVKFVAAFREKYHKDPGILAVTAYDALYILTAAFRETGPDVDTMADYIRNYDFDCVSGNLRFTKGGDVIRSVKISIGKSGKFVPVVKNYDWEWNRPKKRSN